jgi:hypothetical protein
MIGAPAFELHRKRSPSELGVTTLNEIVAVMGIKQQEQEALALDDPELRQEALSKIPKCYHQYLDVFSKVESNDLPPPRLGVDHKITLDPERGAHPAKDLGYSGLYRLSLEELEICRTYIEDQLKRGFIEPSDAPWAAPILFVKKPNGGLRFCVDYRKLNAMTIRDQYPLPLIEETMRQVATAKIFTKIDIRQAFHRIRMDPDSVDLTTFRTRYDTSTRYYRSG